MNLSLDHEIAGLFCVGFEGKSPSPEVKELLRRGVHGVILFSRNVEDAEQVASLVAELKRLAGRPLLVSIDQEGGRSGDPSKRFESQRFEPRRMMRLCVRFRGPTHCHFNTF